MSERPEAYDQFVRERIAAGDEPDDITGWIEDSLVETSGYVLWGDGRWRIDDVCAICGSPYAGVCGHAAFNIPKVLRSEFVPGRHGDPEYIKCNGCGRVAKRSRMKLSITGKCKRCEAQYPYVPMEREVAG